MVGCNTWKVKRLTYDRHVEGDVHISFAKHYTGDTKTGILLDVNKNSV